MSDRVFGENEAKAMFEAIANALALLERGGGETAGEFLRELQKERGMLTDQRRQVHLALLRDGKNDPAEAGRSRPPSTRRRWLNAGLSVTLACGCETGERPTLSNPDRWYCC